MTLHHASPFAPRRAALRAEMTDQMIQADPHLIAACTALPLDCREMIPDETLRRFANPAGQMIAGELCPDLAREIAMLLPDLAGELLARRLMADAAERRNLRAAK
jgi:hypothetical protein